jgi:hypothetical protein
MKQKKSNIDRDYLPLREYYLAVTADNTTINNSVFMPYLDINGRWRMKFNVYVSVSSATRTSFTLTMPGINIAYLQAISAFSSSSSVTMSRTLAHNTNELTTSHSSGTTTYYGFSGDIELASKPTFME